MVNSLYCPSFSATERTESTKSPSELFLTRRSGSMKEHSAVAVLHNDFRRAVNRFLLPPEPFHLHKSESEGFFFFSRAAAFLFFKENCVSFFARMQRLLSWGVGPAVDLPVSRGHPLPDVHSRHVRHTDSLHLQRRDGQYPAQLTRFVSSWFLVPVHRLRGSLRLTGLAWSPKGLTT